MYIHVCTCTYVRTQAAAATLHYYMYRTVYCVLHERTRTAEQARCATQGCWSTACADRRGTCRLSWRRSFWRRPSRFHRRRRSDARQGGTSLRPSVASASASFRQSRCNDAYEHTGVVQAVRVKVQSLTLLRTLLSLTAILPYTPSHARTCRRRCSPCRRRRAVAAALAVRWAACPARTRRRSSAAPRRSSASACSPVTSDPVTGSASSPSRRARRPADDTTTQATGTDELYYSPANCDCI